MKKMLLLFLLASINSFAQNLLPIHSDAYSASVNLTGQNLDSVTAVGFYRGTSMVNAPGGGWWYILVESHNNSRGADGWTKQTVTAYGAGNAFPAGTTFIRNQINTSWTPWMLQLQLNRDGNVGIGTTAPSSKLHIISEANASGSGGAIILGPTNGANLRIGYNTGYSWIQSHGVLPLYINEVGNNTVLNLNAGNVGIGTTRPQSKLAVNGTISATRIKVTQDGWADYVFDSSYQLPSLSHVETFIKENKHLPEVPSAVEVKKDGLDLGDNQAILLRKIEELTLYIIQQNKEMTEMKKRLADVEARQSN